MVTPQDLKVKAEQRGVAHIHSEEEKAWNSAKRVAHNDWEDAVRQNRTEVFPGTPYVAIILRQASTTHSHLDTWTDFTLYFFRLVR